MKNMENHVICGLIRGRHTLPDGVSLFVFTADIPQENICDSSYMDAVCTAFLDRYAPSKISVYVTGFTPALLSLVKICRQRDIGLSAYHYDREGKVFWEQEVL